ncbi:ATPase component ABC-type multidrug transport system [Methylophaga aminisulfidivorans MP]|uniref:ATPase component ABC-type multidrug transport system n=2 Tax=Methylophaga TaxID=40222 RepID=F5T2R2_9GAMM|nr:MULTISPECIES: ATP-binding cassette domain-containing protein [Methylophaga]EGL53280.1 ATPase component ABC-type multidrug transport system [Methylophaga aminisulfidivorans MP]GLP99767.1 multidrug ABC transporter ATP-binding protein [Methylophaga thalassica]
MIDPILLLEAKELSRFFGDTAAVNNVSFNIKQGEVLGFLGPNGAGKSTTMRMLTGNLAPDNGQIIINGIDLLDNPKQAKACIGYLPETPPLYKEHTVSEFLQFCARLNGIAKKQQKTAVDNVIERCGLADVSKRLIANLSKGFQQRVGIAQAIIHSPAVVILDEPTSGLDPIQIREIRQLIRDIANEHSVILSTHILPEVQMLCDRVQIISKGQLLFNDSLQKLTEQMQSTAIVVGFSQSIGQQSLTSLPGVIDVEKMDSHRYRVTYLPEQNPTQALLKSAVENNWPLRSLIPEQHSLEDVFMKIIREEDAHA